MIFDTHAHYDDEAFDEDREQLLAAFKENGIGATSQHFQLQDHTGAC